MVQYLIHKYKTRDPFEIARSLRIHTILEPLGVVRGYYHRILHQKFIHINCDLPEREKLLVCAHELGHAVLHPEANTPFMRGNTLYSITRFEREANYFAADLLIDESLFKEHPEFTSQQLSSLLGFPEALVQMKMDLLPCE